MLSIAVSELASPVLSADGRIALLRRGAVALLLGIENGIVVRGEPTALERVLAGPPDDDDELASIHAALLEPPDAPPDFARQRVAQLNIGNTSRCNMRCSYCYNALPIKGSEDPRTAATAEMTPELARTTVDALVAGAGDELEELMLVFIGGESLLQRELLEETVRHAKRRCRERELDLGVVIYTNGLLMNRSVIEWANDEEVSLVVSLDGPPALHDRHRLFPGGAPTSAAVLRNIELLVRHSTHPLRRVRAVVTAREALLPLHQYLYDLGFNEILVQAAYSEAGYEGRDELLDLRELTAWYRTLLLAGVVISIHPFEQILERLHLRGQSVLSWYPCNAGIAALGVDGRGDLYPCHHFLGEASHRLGNVCDGIPGPEARRGLHVRIDQRELCRDCWARHLCGGECYHRALAGGHGYDGVVAEWCRAKQAVIVEGLDLLTEVAERRPQALEDLLAMRLFLPPVNDRAFELQDLGPYLVLR